MSRHQDLQRHQDTSRSETEAISNAGRTPGPPGTNPFTHEGNGATGGTGGVNPSGTTAGTEGWGLASGEANTIGENEGPPRKANPGESQHDDADPGDVQPETVPVSKRTFRCADAGNADCRWETSARTEDELMDSIERHGRHAHGIQDFNASTRRKFQNAIRES